MTIRGFRLYHGIDISNKRFYELLKKYNNFEMQLGVRCKLVLTDAKESKKFFNFIIANSNSK